MSLCINIKLTNLQFPESSFFLLLKKGTILALFQSSGTSSDLQEFSSSSPRCWICLSSEAGNRCDLCATIIFMVVQRPNKQMSISLVMPQMPKILEETRSSINLHCFFVTDTGLPWGGSIQAVLQSRCSGQSFPGLQELNTASFRNFH